MSDILAELVAQPWAMEPKALEAFLARVRGASAVLPQDNWTLQLEGGKPWSFIGDLTLVAGNNQPAAAFGEDAPKRQRMSVTNGVARIPISGVLLKKVPAWLRWFGVDATSYSDIQDDIASALSNDGVKEIVLSVDSPGGQVAGVHEAGEAIQAARGKGKPITAEVMDLCASAAYWLASQAHRITAGPNAQIGSIGVYSVYVDSSKAAADEGFKVHVISSGPHKGAGVPGAPITDVQLKGFQAVIDGMAQNFKDAVARGRGRGAEMVAEWATGQVWLAAAAKSMGLIDSVTSMRAERPAGGPSAASDTPHIEEESMSDPKQAADQDKIRSEAATQERESSKSRIGAIKAAFPEDPIFALSQIESGATVEQAKAAYNDVLKVKLAESEKARKLAEEKANKGKTGALKGGDPIVSVGEPGSQTGEPIGFLQRAEKLAEEKGWTKTEAMSYLARNEKELYEAFLESTGAGAIVAKRREMNLKTGARR